MQRNKIIRLATAGILVAVAVAGSTLYFPVFSSKWMQSKSAWSPAKN